MFFLLSLAKLLVIAGAFFIIHRLAPKGVVFFIQGLAMIYIGIAGAGIRRMLSDMSHGT